MVPEFQTDGVFDVYKMLDIIRERPRMYLGDERSLTNLWWLLFGYQWALDNHNIPYRKEKFWKFPLWVGGRFGICNTMGYHQVILQQCEGDEAKALEMFFQLLEEFRREENEL